MESSLLLILVRLFLLCSHSCCKEHLSMGEEWSPFPAQSLEELTGVSPIEGQTKFTYNIVGEKDAQIRLTSKADAKNYYNESSLAWIVVDLGAGNDTYSFIEWHKKGGNAVNRKTFNTHQLLSPKKVNMFTLKIRGDTLTIHKKNNYQPIIYFKEDVVRECQYFSFASRRNGRLYWSWGYGKAPAISKVPNCQKFNLLDSNCFTSAYYLPDWKDNKKEDTSIVFRFKIMASDIAYFRLSPGRTQSFPKQPSGVEVTISDRNLHTSVDMYTANGNKTDQHKGEYTRYKGKLLSSTEMRPFKMILEGTTLRIFAGDNSEPFVNYAGDAVAKIKYISFAGPAKWTFNCKEKPSLSESCPSMTEKQLEYYCRRSGILPDTKARVKAADDCKKTVIAKRSNLKPIRGSSLESGKFEHGHSEDILPTGRQSTKKAIFDYDYPEDIHFDIVRTGRQSTKKTKSDYDYPEDISFDFIPSRKSNTNNKFGQDYFKNTIPKERSKSNKSKFEHDNSEDIHFGVKSTGRKIRNKAKFDNDFTDDITPRRRLKPIKSKFEQDYSEDVTPKGIPKANKSEFEQD